MKKPNPGSDEAIDLGCCCPILDNEHGKGAYGDGKMFWYAEGCPVHAPNKISTRSEDKPNIQSKSTTEKDIEKELKGLEIIIPDGSLKDCLVYHEAVVDFITQKKLEWEAEAIELERIEFRKEMAILHTIIKRILSSLTHLI